MDETTAERVFTTLYPLYAHASRVPDPDTIGAIEAGVAREHDLVQCQAGCREPHTDWQTVTHTFSAPPQSSYPAFFVARVNRLGEFDQAVTEIVVFARQSRDAPWLIALDDSTEGPNPILDANNAGLGAPVPQLPGPDPMTLPSVLAAYWQHWWDTGSAPTTSVFLGAAGLSERGRTFAALRSQNPSGVVQSRIYSTDSRDRVFVVRAYAGQVLACGAVHYIDWYVPAPGIGFVEQDTFASTLPRVVPPGKYTRVEVRGLEEDCFLVGPGGQAAPFYTEALRSFDDPTTLVPFTH